MANRRTSMRKIREVIRLGIEGKLSNRQISRALGVSRPVVSQYLIDFRASGLGYNDIGKLSDDELMTVLSGTKEKKSEEYRVLSEKFEHFATELKKPGVTLHILWDEYIKENFTGFSYSRFCYHYQVWRNSSYITMHIEHKAGDKMFVDYAGKRLKIHDRKTGRVREVEVLVAILPASQYTYVEAMESQTKEDWLKGNDNALQYFEGVPLAIVPDCLKTGVTNGNKYEPDINPEYADLARHYNTVILPARPHSPKDKAMVENAVRIVYARIYAPLRNKIFYSIAELNEAVWEQLEIHNNTPFQRMKTSRKQLYDETEKALLKPLSAERYERKGFSSRKVQFNYHVELGEDKHYYSVPWRYKGKQVTLICTATTVEIYYNNMRIAAHTRDRTVNGYSTLKEHRSPNHAFYDDWSPQKFINWGYKVGDSVKTMIEKVLESRQYPEQAYKVCMGILNLPKKYSDARVNNACKRALQFDNYSYKAVKTILEKGLDKLQEETLLLRFPEHKNIRGNQYFS